MTGTRFETLHGQRVDVEGSINALEDEIVPRCGIEEDDRKI